MREVSTSKMPDTVTAFVIRATLMIAVGLIEIFLGVRAERRSLEDIARPLTAQGMTPTADSHSRLPDLARRGRLPRGEVMSRPAQPRTVPDAQPHGGREPGSARTTGGAKAVLVSVDGSGASRAAIALAAQEARYRDAPLVAVQAYSGERVLGEPAARPVSVLRTVEDDRIATESSLRRALRETLGDLAGNVEVHAVLGLAGRKVVEMANKTDAQLIVLSSRGSPSMVLGTVSQYVLRKAPCPVLVVPVAPTAMQCVGQAVK